LGRRGLPGLFYIFGFLEHLLVWCPVSACQKFVSFEKGAASTRRGRQNFRRESGYIDFKNCSYPPAAREV